MQDAIAVFVVFILLVFWIFGLLSAGIADRWKEYYKKLASAGWRESADGRITPLSPREGRPALYQALSWQIFGVSPMQSFSRCVTSLPFLFKIHRLKKTQRKLYTKDQIEFLENLRFGLIDPLDLPTELARRFPQGNSSLDVIEHDAARRFLDKRS